MIETNSTPGYIQPQHHYSEHGLPFSRVFSSQGRHPFEELEWELRTASIGNEKGEMIFEQKDVEVPVSWSQQATNVVVSKYFHGQMGSPQRETSVKQLIGRVADTIAEWGRQQGYFASPEDAEIYQAELNALLVQQRAAFNSPVWFNVGIESKPQCSACQPYHALINTVQGLLPIGEIVEKDLIGLPVYDENGLTQVINTKYNGKKKVYRINLRDGFFVEATADHLVCAHDSRRTQTLHFAKVEDLKPGMFMRVYSHIAETITPESSNQEISEAALAGWLQADGFVGQYEGTNSSLTIEFMVVKQEEYDWVIQHLETVFPDVHYKVSVETAQNEHLEIRRIRLYGEILRPFVEKYELLKRKQDIRVPRSIWTAANDVVAVYLKSLFQGDGYVTIHDSSTRVAFAVISKEWVQELQVLLTRLGIYSRSRQKKENRPDRYDMWELDVSIASERLQFLKKIGFISDDKQDKLVTSCDMEGKICPDIRFSEIISIEAQDETDVYDIQTLSGHYLTNGVLVHNCFINSVQDNMDSILSLAKTEGMLFKWGSGTGTNFSSLRSSKEALSGGGTASGPVSFMRGYDAFAGVIKSGGKTRRAAKMVILNIDHPDIEEFIESKANEEKKAWALIDAGYNGGFNVPGGAYDSVQFQNANHSVRVTDEFMRAAEEDREWHTRAVSNGEIVETLKARKLLMGMAESTWICGDPGIQYDTTINRWHTAKASGRINASNPCSEYLFLDDTACNLASINLLKYYENGQFQVDAFKHTIRLLITAQEIVVEQASYPTPAIEKNSHRFRTLGLGYSNLGALLMAQGLPYDGDTGRHYAAAISALMTGEAYRVSAELAESVGPFEGFPPNRDYMLEVMRLHQQSLDQVKPVARDQYLLEAARQSWQAALDKGEKAGYRNAQVSVLAPTGTIAFLMDCVTTGIEPDLALIKYKRLVGGGNLKIVNQTVPLALENLGYSENEISEILDYLNNNDTIEGAPGLRKEDLPVFDCAFKPLRGSRSIHYMGHIRMMGAVQPFISGAISKTVNMPSEATVEEIYTAYLEAWKLGVKAVAIYRDGSKRTQPLNTGKESPKTEASGSTPQRRRLPNERQAITHKFSIAGHEGYLTVGMYEDGSPGEIFITMAKEGSVISGLMDSFATTVSLALQYGVPLPVLVDKLSHTRFEPSGYTGNKDIPFAKSIMDYIFRWLAIKFLPHAEAEAQGLASALKPTETEPQALNGQKLIQSSQEQGLSFVNSQDAPPCNSCGAAVMVRNGSCYKCMNCGATSGCS